MLLLNSYMHITGNLVTTHSGYPAQRVFVEEASSKTTRVDQSPSPFRSAVSPTALSARSKQTRPAS